MNTKKFFLAFIVVYVLFEITNFIIHGVILAPTYMSDGVKEVFRDQIDMEGKMWIIWLTDLVWAFFFVFFFVKGYENKGVMEGVRFGFYIGLFHSLLFAYQNYTLFPLPYSLAFQWFIFGMIQALLLAIVTAILYKPNTLTIK